MLKQRDGAAPRSQSKERRSGEVGRVLPASIASAEDLKAHLDSLLALDARFAPLMERVGEVPLRRVEPGFKGLFWIITGQQISTTAARAIFARCETALETMSAECVAAIDDATLKTAGLSAGKIRTLRAASAAVIAGQVGLDDLDGKDAEAAIAELVTIKGIGRWTAEVYLLFALGHVDVFPAGDLALKESARMAFSLPDRPAEKALTAHAERWRPCRSAAARLLWAYYAVAKRGDATPA